MATIQIRLEGSKHKLPVCDPNPAPAKGTAKWDAKDNDDWEVIFEARDPVHPKTANKNSPKVKFTYNASPGQRIKYVVRLFRGDTWYEDDPELIVDE